MVSILVNMAQELLAEIETLIRQLGSWRPDPSADQFARARQEIERELLPDLSALNSTIDVSQYRGQLQVIARMGERALEDEMGDVLFILACMANQQGIDLEAHVAVVAVRLFPDWQMQPRSIMQILKLFTCHIFP